MKKLLVVLLAVMSFSVFATPPFSFKGHKHEHEDAIPEVNTYYSINSKGVASAIAQAQCDVDRSTYDGQGCVSFGHFESTTAINYSHGIRLNAEGDLVKFSVSFEAEKFNAFGAGFNWKY